MVAPLHSKYSSKVCFCARGSILHETAVIVVIQWNLRRFDRKKPKNTIDLPRVLSVLGMRTTALSIASSYSEMSNLQMS